MKRIFLLLMASVAMIAASAQITGQWTGEISVSGFSLKLNFNFATDDSGKTTCTIDSPDQNAFDIPCQEVSITDNSVNVKIDVIKATYSGTIQGDSIVGNFTQGATLPLTLRRNAKPQTKIERKQTPQPPFPYTVKEVTFANPAAGITLAGTLTLPENTKNVPAVVMITGSGAQNRDEELFAHRPFAVIADYLTRQGIAVLRYDDRGTAASGGKFANATTADFATDARAALDFLASQPEINKKKLGYIGHSEGGQIAFINAAADDRVAFIVTLAAPAIKGSDLLIRQNEMLVEAISGMKLPEDQLSPLKQIFDAIERNTDSESLRKELIEILKLDLATPEQRENFEKQIEASTSPWYMQFVKYDPADAIKATKCPVFALGGTYDIQVEASTNIARIKELCGSKSVTTKEYPGMNHMFQQCANAKEGFNYGKIEQTIAPEVLTDIATWILTR